MQPVLSVNAAPFDMQFMGTWHWATSDIKIQIKLGLFNLFVVVFFFFRSFLLLHFVYFISFRWLDATRCGCNWKSSEKEWKLCIQIVKMQWNCEFILVENATFLLTLFGVEFYPHIQTIITACILKTFQAI